MWDRGLDVQHSLVGCLGWSLKVGDLAGPFRFSVSGERRKTDIVGNGTTGELDTDSSPRRGIAGPGRLRIVPGFSAWPTYTDINGEPPGYMVRNWVLGVRWLDGWLC
jgi:hypothetical protein